MTSKSSFFDLLKENFLRRVWTMAFAVLVFFFVFPINIMLSADMYLKNQANMTAKEIEQAKGIIYRGFTSVTKADGGIFAVIVMFAVLTGISGFAYLHSRKKTDFYHSLPVSRTKLYAAVAVNSILTVAVPYLVMALLSAVITGIKTGYTGCISYALVNFVYGMCAFTLIYMTTVLAMMLTGTKTTGLMGTAVLLFYGPAVTGLIYGLMDRYFWTFYPISDRAARIMTYLSPLYWGMSKYVSAPERAAAAAAAAVVLCIINIMLYKIRRSEAAGIPMAFKHTETVIKVLITVPAAVGAGLFFSSMTELSDFWTVFAIICGAIIIHSIIEIIYNLDFRKLFADKLHLAGCMAAALAIFVLFRFDLAGYDSYMPDTSKVASAGAFSYAMSDIYGDEANIDLSDNDGGGQYAYYTNTRSDKDAADAMNITDISGIKAIADCGIGSAKEYASEGPKYGSAYYARDDQDQLSSILVAWHLNNGKTVYRQYNIDLHKVHDEIEALHDSAEFRKAVYPIIDSSDEAIADMVGVNFYDAFGPHHVTFNGASDDKLKNDIRKLAETYIRELSGLTAETRRHEYPVTALQFKNSRFQSMSDTIKQGGNGYLGLLNDAGYYPVYPSFRETLALLESFGVRLNNGLTAADISTVIISDANGYYTDSDGNAVTPKPDLIVNDRKQIQEILDSIVYAVNVSNSLDKLYYGVGANAYLTRPYAELGQQNEPDDIGAGAVIDTSDAVYGADMAASDSSFAAGTALINDKRVSGYYDVEYNNESLNSINLTFEYDKMPQFVRDYFEINDNNSLENISGTDRW